MASTSVKKQMQAQQCGSCGVQDFKIKINTIFTAAVPLRFPKNLYQMDFSSLLDNQLV